ncbi:MAG: PAS domain S-box protein [Chthoniobacterales bacterium]|nr:PAS domain S-box protein [Chthoniobacterales bacterium]
MHRTEDPVAIVSTTYMSENDKEHPTEARSAQGSEPSAAILAAANEQLILSGLRQLEEADKLNEQLKAEIGRRQAVARGLAEKARLLDLSNDAIIVRDVGNRIIYWNHGAKEIFGWTRDEAVGQDLHALLKTEFEHPFEELIAKLHREHRMTGEIVQFARDGRRVELLCRWSLDHDAEGAPASILTTATEITERRQAEKALRESEERFRALADNIPQLAWMTDAEGWIFWYNQRWLAYTGTTLEEVRGWGWEKVIHPDHLPPVMNRWKQSLRTGKGFEDTLPLLGADGQYRWFLSRAVPIRDDAGQVQRWFGTNTDVTEQREVNDALSLAKEQCEATSRAKDDFLAALSHELRTPLTPVLMMASAMASDPEVPTELREQLEMMRRSVELEARLIDDLLDLTRISRGRLAIEPVPTDVHDLIQHTAEIARSDGLTKQVRLVFTLEAERHHALADPARLQQVIWNLIKNALKFTPTGGTITVSTRNDAEGGIVVSVEDTGIGISAAALPHVFRAFEQGDIAGQHRYGGLGLGLAISHAIVEIHGGALRAESSGVGLGATFSLSLGTVDASAATVPAAVPLPVPRRTLQLLIVEDHETTRTVLSRLLSRDGHTVTTAGTIHEALLAFGAARFDLVVSDLGLPDGNGLDLMRELQRQRPVPGIALSGYGMEEDLRQSKAAGFFAHLVKPVNIEQLRQLLDGLGAGGVSVATR